MHKTLVDAIQMLCNHHAMASFHFLMRFFLCKFCGKLVLRLILNCRLSYRNRAHYNRFYECIPSIWLNLLHFPKKKSKRKVHFQERKNIFKMKAKENDCNPHRLHVV